MKHIFIFWTERLNEQRGGVHRVILILLKHLPALGFDVHYLYTLDDYRSFKLYNSDHSLEEMISVENLKDYLIEHKCDIILGQDAAFSSSLTTLVKKMNIPGVKLVSEYHTNFRYIYNKLNYNFLKFEFTQNPSLRAKLSILFRFIFFPLWKKRVWKILAKNFRYTLTNSDVSLLLSAREIPIAKSILGTEQNVRFVSIPNPLSWEKVEEPAILQQKKKEVLVVSRLYNPEKRIDIVLKVWKKLQDRGCIDDWTLTIIGDGLHKDYLMQMSADMNLCNVVWKGWGDPKPYYKKASIFMMTSASEGWGLTLTESMQTGTVPIALDTYPALHDIITDAYDGYIVKPNDIKTYTDRMQFLIENPLEREKIALNGLESCKRFSTEKVMDKWAEMLKNVD